MDKVGPIARTIAPLGPVLAAIIGTDPADPTTVDYPFAAPCGLGTKHEDGGDVTLPRSISFTGQLYGEERLLALAATWQKATGHHLARPPI